jgi:Tfp pilus assembly protein PilN
MIKHPKQVYAIAEDGSKIRLVRLTRDKDIVYLHDLDQIDLEKSLYAHTEEELSAGLEAGGVIPGPEFQDSREISLDDFTSDYTAEIQLSPWENTFNSYDLHNGVLAVNINDENIIRYPDSVLSGRALKQFARSSLSPGDYKAKNWTACSVKIANRPHTWLHHGSNQLLSMLDQYAKKHKRRFYFQLADANDIALADYFRVLRADPEKRTLLVYLGSEHRRAYLFEKGAWITTLQLQISQPEPDPEIVYSKLALALDSAQLADPEEIVLCGDKSSGELLDYLRQQYSEDMVHFLSFPELVISSEKTNQYDSRFLAQFALPIALAYKALHPEDERFSPTNFLPPKILEGQKYFKVAWHGFMVLMAVFAVVFYATFSILQIGKSLNEAKALKRNLDKTLAQRRAQANEIQKIRSDLESQQKSMEVMKGVLEGKNPWALILDKLNRRFAERPVSWLTNVRKNGEQLSISGVTTNRANVLEFAALFPNGQINKVAQAMLKDTTVWQFDISSDFPVVDWWGDIQRDLEELMALKQLYGEETAAENPGASSSQSTANLPPGTVSTPVIKNLQQYKGLKPIPAELMPKPSERTLKSAGAEINEYNAIISAINRANMWEYRDLASKFLSKYSKSSLAPYVRWHMANRMFIDAGWDMVFYYTGPLLSVRNDMYPYALLVRARTNYVRGNELYKKEYSELKNDFSRHPLNKVVTEDLAQIARGGAK